MAKAKAAAAKQPDYFQTNFDFDVPIEVLGVGLWNKRGSSTYEAPRCAGCGKADAIECLRNGSSHSVDPARVKVEWGHTLDAQTVMSSRMLATLRKIPGVEIDAFPIGPGKKPTHWVVWPTQLFPAEPIAPQKKLLAPPPPGIAYLSHGAKCKKCQRFETITGNPTWISIPAGLILCGIALEKPDYQSPDWVFNADVAEVIKKYPHARLRLKGIENRPPAAKKPKVTKKPIAD